MTDLPFHSLASIFPLMEGAEFDALVTSIKENGLREPIVLFEGAVLDGRNRYRACKAAEVEPTTAEFNNHDPIEFVLDKNLRRRHLDESQRGAVAARLANLSVGRPTEKKKGQIWPISIPAKKAAEMLNVGRGTVVFAKKVLKEGTPEEIRAVEEGRASVSAIAKAIIAKIPQSQRKIGRKAGWTSGTGKNPERIENLRIKGQIWGQVRDSLTNLTGLPMPSEVVGIVRSNDKTRNLVNARLGPALQWLQEFSDAWNERDQARAS